MAYQMSYTDERLTTHAESVWLPMFVAFDHGARTGRIVFNGYTNLAALLAGAPVIAQKGYDVNGDVYLGIVGGAPAEGSATILDAVSSACYAYAATVLDKPGAEPEDPKVSFFDGATEISISA